MTIQSLIEQMVNQPGKATVQLTNILRKVRTHTSRCQKTSDRFIMTDARPKLAMNKLSKS